MENTAKDGPSKVSRLLMGPEEFTNLNPCKLFDDDGDDDDDDCDELQSSRYCI